MIIHVVDRTDGAISRTERRRVISAINKQISRDFVPFWGMPCKLLDAGSSVPKKDLPDVQDACVMYLQTKVDVDDAVGYHDRNAKGIPFGVVFTELAEQLGEPWSVTMSHEALELIGDPQANLLVMGPRPKKPSGDVFHWFEMCDAVQDQSYAIDKVMVSNFVLPFYFTVEQEGQNDFMDTGLKSLKVNPGGYIGYYDPLTGDHESFLAKGDKIAQQRLAIKSQLGRAHRSQRYKTTSEQRLKVSKRTRG